MKRAKYGVDQMTEGGGVPVKRLYRISVEFSTLLYVSLRYAHEDIRERVLRHDRRRR